MTPSERDHVRRQIFSLAGRISTGRITDAEMQRYHKLREQLSSFATKRASGQYNNKPRSEFCPGIPQLSEDAALACLAPRDEAHEAEISAEIWTIAAQIRNRHMPGAGVSVADRQLADN